LIFNGVPMVNTVFLINWRSRAKAWISTGIRYPVSPCPDLWVFLVVIIQLLQLTRKHSAWEVRPQG